MRRRPWLAAWAPALVAACVGRPGGGPPDVQVGLEECGYCRMIISEERHAAALVDAAGVATSFDDVGWLLAALVEGPEAASEAWVHDHAGGAWIAAEHAWFVRGPREATPMGSGLLAFASRAQAQASARDASASVVTWESLAARPGAP